MRAFQYDLQSLFAELPGRGFISFGQDSPQLEDEYNHLLQLYIKIIAGAYFEKLGNKFMHFPILVIGRPIPLYSRTQE
jgi:hypothetical protein